MGKKRRGAPSPGFYATISIEMLDNLTREMQTRSWRSESRMGSRGIYWLECLCLMAMVWSCRQTPNAAPAGDVYLELGPMIGHVGPDEANIWVKASGRARLSSNVACVFSRGVLSRSTEHAARSVRRSFNVLRK